MFAHSGFYFITLLFLAIIGFWPTYFSKLFGDIDNYTHFHAVTMLLWMGMLITQAFLIRYRRHSLHRWIGKFSYLLVPFIILSTILLAHSQIDSIDSGISASRRYILFLQLSLLTLFTVAYSLAIANRHNPARHARCMICTALPLIDPAVARIPLDLPSLPVSYQAITFTLTNIILVVLIVMERHHRQGREVFPVMLVVFLIFQYLNLTSTNSVMWKNFTGWFAKLPLT